MREEGGGVCGRVSWRGCVACVFVVPAGFASDP